MIWGSIFWGIVLWLILLGISGLVYLPVAQPMYAGVLLLVSMVVSWGLHIQEQLMDDDDWDNPCG